MSMRGRAGSPHSSAQRVSLMAMMTALAFVLSWIENLFPPIAGHVPGIKLGLANVVVLIMLYHSGFAQAGLVSLIRVLMVSFVFGSPSQLPYGLAGGSLSLLIMTLAKRLGCFSPAGVSVLGGLFHNIGQITMAMIILNGALWGSMPILMVAGAVTGAATGVVATGVLRYLKALPGPIPKAAVVESGQDQLRKEDGQ